MSWEPIDLAKLDERPATLPSLGDVGLVYPGKRHVFSGPPESAKTLAAYAVAIGVVRDGGNVLLIDFEMGRWDARDRLREMSATCDDLARIFYVEPETPATESLILDLVERWTFTLVILDASAGAFDLQALDDNKRQDVGVFNSLYVEPFRHRDIATIVLDHVAKKRSNGWAIGSERKIGATDVHLGFETVLPLTRGGRGLYKITTRKDRPARLERPRAADLELRSNPETEAIEWTFRPPAIAAEDTPFRPTRLMEKVSRYLEATSSRLGDEVSRNQVEQNVTGKAHFVRLAIDALIVEDCVAESLGSRGSRLVRSLRPYREDDLVPTSSPPRPDEVAETQRPRPSFPPPKGGTRTKSRSPDVDENEIERLADLARRVQRGES